MIGVKLAILALVAASLPRSLAGTRTEMDSSRHPEDGAIRAFRRHLYILPNMCQKEVRELKFSEQVILESQQSGQDHYSAPGFCAMKFKPHSAEIGLIVAFKVVDTATCEDFLKVTPEDSQTNLLCGPDDAMQRSTIFSNGTVEVAWSVAEHSEALVPGKGFQMVLTAFQHSCPANEKCFSCTNGLYVHQHNVCNGQNNCGDMSDELDCPDYHTSVASPGTENISSSHTESNESLDGTSTEIDHSSTRKEPEGSYPYKLHIFILPEMCDPETRTMRFSDQVILESQHPGQPSYPTDGYCAMKFETESEDVGLVVAFKIVDTDSCQDFLTVVPGKDAKVKFCGHLFTDDIPEESKYYGNQTVEIQWSVAKHRSKTIPGKGFQMVVTAFQLACPPNESCFNCSNGLKVHAHNVCNGQNNCGDLSDEVDCPDYNPVVPTTKVESHFWFIVLVLLSCLLFLALVGASLILYRIMGQRNSLLQQRDDTVRHHLLNNQQETES